jgi:hypothetical protein
MFGILMIVAVFAVMICLCIWSTRLCPYCHSQPMAFATKCPRCGADLKRKRPPL